MKKRIAIWDNLKFLLIIFVVFGHYATQLYENDDILRGMYISVYTFHMPAFIFVTGLFSKKAVNEKNVKKILPYLTCFFATSVILFITKAAIGWAPTFQLLDPAGLPWYLMSMFFMYLITMLVKDYKPQYIFILSLFVGVMCGYATTSNPDLFTWMRTIVFYPFFYLGYILDQEKTEKITNKLYLKICAVIFFVMLNVLIFEFPEQSDILSRLNTARHPYSHLGDFGPLGWLYKILGYAVSFAAVFFLISLVPRKRIKGFTAFGERTLGIYMFHYIIIYVLIYVLKTHELLKSVLPNGWEYLIIPLAIITAYICGNKGFNFIVQKLFSVNGKLKG